VNNWSARGPFGATVRDVAFHPSDSSLVYAAAGPSLFRSNDGGQTWTELSHDFGASGIADFAFDPSNPARLYVGSYDRGLLVTTDAANTFTRVGPEPADPTADGPYRIAISANGQTIYYFTLGSKFLSSTDRGATFSQQVLASQPRALAISPANDAVLYVATSSGVIKTTNAGADWTDLPRPSLFDSWIEGIAIVPGTPDELWIASDGNMFSTEDDGQNWIPLVPALPERRLQQDPNYPTRLYATNIFGRYEPIHHYQGGSWVALPDFKDQVHAIAASPANASLMIIGAASGIWRSMNDGAAWDRFNTGLTAHDMRSIAAGLGVIYAGTLHGELVRATGDSDFESVSVSADFPLASRNLAIYTLAVQPSNANVVVATTAFGGLMTSHDAGASWSRGDFQVNNAVVDTVAFDPSDGLTVYASSVPVGINTPTLQRSRDAGLTFSVVDNNLSPDSRIGHIAVDPKNSNRLFAAKLWTSLDLEADGLFRSDDAGATWVKVHENAGTQDVAIDPSNSNLVYAVADGDVLISNNGGDSFSSSILPLTPLGTPARLALDPETSGVLYVIASNRTGTKTDYHVMRSVDAGTSWERITNPQQTGWIPRQLLVHPERPTVLHAATSRGVHSYEVAADLSAAIIGHTGGTQGVASSFEVRLSNEGLHAATGVLSEIQVTGAVQVTAATIDGGACNVTGSVITCSVPHVKVTGPATARVNYTTSASGAVNVQATAQAREHDPARANNAATATASFTAPTPAPAPTPTPSPPPTSGGGGGGGSTSLALLLGLYAVAVAARTRRRRG
jgi:photosystem II stability/assembly factor-like uncharacterized protein